MMIQPKDMAQAALLAFRMTPTACPTGLLPLLCPGLTRPPVVSCLSVFPKHDLFPWLQQCQLWVMADSVHAAAACRDRRAQRLLAIWDGGLQPAQGASRVCGVSGRGERQAASACMAYCK